MAEPGRDGADPRLARLPRALQWLLMLALSAAFVALFEAGRLPAALLVGPMLAGIVAGTNGATVRVWRPAFLGAQSVVGVLVATAIAPGNIQRLLADWALFAGVVAATIAASSFLGWLISRWRVLPGTTAVWGSSPGASTAMVLMAEAFGADARLVAFMQYLRVIIVSVAAALIARLWVDASGVAPPPVVWFPALDPAGFSATLAACVLGTWGFMLLRLPSPAFLGTFIVAAALHLGLGVAFQLPQWMLALSYALVGWAIGLNFTRTILLHAARALPQVIGSILALIAFCGLLAWMLTGLLGIDPLTAYLATSPGGMDAVAIIAAASHNVDISFIMALQLARFLVVLLLGPAIARAVARLVGE